MAHGLVALLPMKAHSERIKDKNFKPFAGKPLFRWIVDTLLETTEVEKVVINTDARQILAAAGLTDSDRIMIRDRRPEICGDLVSMNKILADDVENVSAKTFLMTHTTNPNLSVRTIRAALQQYYTSIADGSCDSLFSVNRVQTRFYKQDGTAVNHDPGKLLRTQDLEPWFEENSCLYVFSRGSFTATHSRIGAKPYLFETPRLESIDIDDQESWHLAEVVKKTGLPLT